jgi:hypothetical protein
MFNNRHDFKGTVGTTGASDDIPRESNLLKENINILTDIISVIQESPNNMHDYEGTTVTPRTKNKDTAI